MNQSQHNIFNKGLNLDLRELHQPEGTYRFALNAINEAENGSNLQSLSNESGNYECLNFPKGTIPVGSILLLDSEIILFLQNTSHKDSIVLADLKTCTYETLLEGSCLNFKNQVQGVYKTLNGCDRVIYFVDGLNPDRVVNIDNILNNPTSHFYLNDYGIFDCSLIKNKRDLNLAYVSNIEVNNSGGNLGLGVYQIILQYEDSYTNPTDYFGYTLPIPIVYGNYGADYRNIMGGDPLLFPITNKSISFTVANIDQKFTYLNIIVGYTKNSITTYYRVDKLAITGDNAVYTLSDVTIDGTIQLNYDKVISSTNPYDVSETITQIDNRLIKANLQGKTRDYSEFQTLATQIKVNYVTKPIKHTFLNSSSTTGLSKSGKAYTDYRTEMRDEIYSKGIVWVFKDGTESPAFHIPGRQKNTPFSLGSFPSSDPNTHSRPNNNTGITDTGWDSALILAEDLGGNLLPDFKFLINSDFVTIAGKRHCERWKAYNTAYRRELNTVDDPYYSKGELGYYESDERYPITKDCSDNYIYPTEIINNKVVGQKIRHHKMPDTTLEEHFTKVDGDNYILPLGLEFSNIIVPPSYASDILGYYIVSEQRTHNNKTIIDKGIVYENYVLHKIGVDDGDKKHYYVQSTVAGRHHVEQGDDFPFIPNYSSIDTDCGSTEYTGITSPTECGNCPEDTTCVGDGPLYCIPNGVALQKSLSFHGPVSKFYETALSSSYVKVERVLKGNIESWTDSLPGNDISRYYKKATYDETYIKPNQQTNLTLEKDPLNIEADVEITEGYFNYGFINANAQSTTVFELNDEIDYVSGSDSFTDGEINVVYNSMKLYNRQMYGQISLRKYYKTHNDIVSKSIGTKITFGGDCFIGEFSFFSSAFTKKCDCYGEDDCGISGVDVNKTLIIYFVESEINTELRHLDLTDTATIENTFWNYFTGLFHDFLDLDWNGSSMNFDDLTLGGGAPWKNGIYMKNKYLYNKDYSKSDSVKPYFSLDISYQFCKDCNEKFPTRLTYSEQRNEEAQADNYRIFLANNYRDLPANTGEITNIFINFDDLYAHTEKSLHKIITKPYQISNDQSTLYIGTGEFFSVPPKEFISLDYGYSGSQCKWGTKSTEYGTIFVNNNTGRIFLLSDTLKDFSDKGLKNWFDENLPINLNDQYKKIKGVDYPYNNQPALKNGIGFLTAYDPRHKRIIITKKDYICINPNVFNTSLYPTFDVNNKDQFINMSWTISYSFLADSWTSWHSYLPNFYYNDSNNFYSSVNNISKTWKHDKYNYQTFYGTKYDHIIEYVLNKDSIVTKTLDNIEYISKFELRDSERNYWIEKDYDTFDRILVYNSYQSSDIRPIIVTRNETTFNDSSDNFSIPSSKNEKTWKINNFRDLVINRNASLFTSKWDAIKTNYFIDKIPNTLVLDRNKDVFELERFRDKYNIIRLFSNKEEDYKITTDLVSSINNISYR